MNYADIHIHALFGVDDGPDSEAGMRAVVDAAYRDGTRLLCLTPHFHPNWLGDNRAAAETAYRALRDYAAEVYPDLALYLGNELRYGKGSGGWLREGHCRTLGDSNAVLVDFQDREKGTLISAGLERLLSGGYTPILAHAERYHSLTMEMIREFRRDGVLIQVDAGALMKQFGLRQWSRACAILRERLADFVSSDAHDCRRRTPQLSRCYQYTVKKFSEGYARDLFWNNAAALLQSDGLEKEEENG